MKNLILALITFFGGILVFVIFNNIFKIKGEFIFWELWFLIGITIVMLLKYVRNQSSVGENRAKWVKRISKKRMSENFKSIYEYIENNFTEELEFYRKSLVKRIIILAIIILVVTLIYFITLTKTNNKEYIEFIFFLVFAIYIFTYRKYNNKYQHRYKDIVINAILDSFPYRLNYQNKRNKELERFFDDGNFIKSNYNKFISDDYISGKAKNIWLEISDISLEVEARKFSYKIWNGVFSFSQINTKIDGELRIKRNKLLKVYNKKRIELDSVEFEKYFDVYGNSNILGLEILTHEVMEEILQFYNMYKIDFEIVIKENRIYIKYDVGDIFEGTIFSKSTNMKSLWVFYNLINFVINLTTKINKILEQKEV